MQLAESRLRTIVRIAGFRILATGLTAFFVGFQLALLLQLALLIIHYLYERSWFKVRWGLESKG